MLEKCEEATQNPEILNSKPKLENSHSNQRNLNNHKHNEKNSNSNSCVSSTNEHLDFEGDLGKFLKENEPKLTDNSLNNLIQSSQNEQIKEINSSLDQLVRFFN